MVTCKNRECNEIFDKKRKGNLNFGEKIFCSLKCKNKEGYFRKKDFVKENGIKISILDKYGMKFLKENPEVLEVLKLQVLISEFRHTDTDAYKLEEIERKRIRLLKDKEYREKNGLPSYNQEYWNKIKKDEEKYLKKLEYSSEYYRTITKKDPDYLKRNRKSYKKWYEKNKDRLKEKIENDEELLEKRREKNRRYYKKNSTPEKRKEKYRKYMLNKKLKSESESKEN